MANVKQTQVRITLSYACAGILLTDDWVANAAPLFRWMVGKKATECKKWVEGKGGTWEVIGKI